MRMAPFTAQRLMVSPFEKEEVRKGATKTRAWRYEKKFAGSSRSVPVPSDVRSSVMMGPHERLGEAGSRFS